jgi:7-keto-8-aminopelargonate synthetase-like enzyme
VNTKSHPPRKTRPVPKTSGGGLAEPLQQLDRTFVLHHGRKLAYFAGCDYFRLSSRPEVLRALTHGLDQFGLNVAASRKTTGNHPLYGQLEDELVRFAAVPAALFVSNGYITNLAVAQALTGTFTHALIDQRAHGSLQDAAQMLGCPVINFPHRDAASAARLSRRLGSRAKIVLLTDGLFSHSGEVAPLDAYLRVLPPHTKLLVDDAHAFGILGKTGRGTAEFLGLPISPRLIQTVTLSKSLGTYGGAILGTQELRDRIIARSRLFVGNTPLPLPLTAAALAALDLLRAEPSLRRRLHFNASYVKGALRDAGLSLNDGPGPIVPIHPHSASDVTKLKRTLLKAGIHPPHINYLGGPKDGYFRVVISSEHTAEQLDALVTVLSHHIRHASRPRP